jgi:hypothetical protein
MSCARGTRELAGPGGGYLSAILSREFLMPRTLFRPLAGGMLTLALVSGTASAQSAALKVGDPAPAFAGVDSYGKPWRSSEVVGDKILVVHYLVASDRFPCSRGFRNNNRCSFE